VLHRDGSWSHEGQPIRNRRLREAFDRSVRYLPEEAKYVVQLGRFRGEIEIEEAGFFVRSFDPASGELALSDRSTEILEASTLRVSPHDGALLCSVKRRLRAAGLPARFSHAAQAALLDAVREEARGRFALSFGGRLHALPEL